ncbi:sensor histidine kinase [Rhizobium leguminosarum]|uniref:sensor histidine kinase n=1 Tax=Rhizobium leguminosarum TaxID=384 RepID=UPI0014427693|nr:sensor histidine kinase [Rhizobium leguminosarum]MBY5841267.1 sensor histidine kinase [Rhizobium leguminosarum]NKM80974.1 RstB [Rhizobium leguminosarum bv. viciae]QSZ07251.1 sensor histidine kinase [Rhizobium leguminosarum]
MFRISARTVLELGSELISSDVIAFYELIKNGFDARTKTGVDIKFNILLRKNDHITLQTEIKKREKPVEALKKEILERTAANALAASLQELEALLASATTHEELTEVFDDAQARLNFITVSDSGSGMSLDDLRRNFLVIGTASRKHAVEEALASGKSETPYLGEKGIGRLSAMRLGERLRVETARPDDTNVNLLDIDWSRFADLDAMLDDIDIDATIGDIKDNSAWSGTRMIISGLSEDWTFRRVKEMAEYDFARLTDPFLDQKTRPRIAIYWNGDRISIPWMSRDLLDQAHARVSGEYVVEEGVPSLRCTLEALDLGFKHPPEIKKMTIPVEDLEAVIIGEHGQIHDQALVSVGPFQFEAHWYNRRRLTAVEAIGDLREVKELQEKWSGILLFRDRFRVFPYGDDDDDWLALDRKALRRSGYTLNKTQFVGRVAISRTGNPALVDQTNREGLRVTPEQHVLLNVMQYVVQNLLGQHLKDVERQYKSQKIDLSDAKTEVTRLEDRAKVALRQLQKLTQGEGKEAVEDLQQTLFEFSDFAARARLRIAQVEEESRQMVEMAGVGLMVEVVAHELARASENALQALDRLYRRPVPQEIRAHIETLRAEMKSISKRVRVLDPLSISGRQRTEIFSLNDLVKDTLEAHETQFLRQNIELKLSLPEKPLRVRAVKGMVIQILENLISNSVYWMSMRAEREPSFKQRISISVHSGPPSIYFEDNGRGIAPENREEVFKPFFSLKEKSKRRGLGLFIAREAAEYHNGKLILDEESNPETGRLHRFILELPDSVIE